MGNEPGPWPDDMTPLSPSGVTRSSSASITRIGLSALVVITAASQPRAPR
jgi:hypothetical protein